jgi:hypothetical protein
MYTIGLLGQSLAKTLRLEPATMVLGIDPKVDYAFKRVFGDERNSEIPIDL